MKARLSGLVTCSLAAVNLLQIAPVAEAETTTMTTKVKQVMVTAGRTFGGCMARLANSPSDALADCGAHWVTFSCSGDFTDVARAYRLLDQAQLAYAMGKNVIVKINDARKHNGYCFASHIYLK